MQRALEALLADVLLGPAPTQTQLAELCERHALSSADRAALLEGHPRLLVYRELVRTNLREAMRLSIPRTIARLGATFDEYFDRFLSERAPRTHYLRDVTPELLDYCRPLWELDPRVPDYIWELALHESLHIEVSARPVLPREHAAAALSLEQGVDFSEALRLVQYRFAVHELDAREDDRQLPAPRQVALLVYRSAEHDVRYLELSPLAHGIVKRLLDGSSLGLAVRDSAAATGSPLTEAVLSGAAQLLADLADRGVIRGPRPLPASAGSPP